MWLLHVYHTLTLLILCAQPISYYYNVYLVWLIDIHYNNVTFVHLNFNIVTKYLEQSQHESNDYCTEFLRVNLVQVILTIYGSWHICMFDVSSLMATTIFIYIPVYILGTCLTSAILIVAHTNKFAHYKILWDNCAACFQWFLKKKKKYLVNVKFQHYMFNL